MVVLVAAMAGSGAAAAGWLLAPAGRWAAWVCPDWQPTPISCAAILEAVRPEPVGATGRGIETGLRRCEGDRCLHQMHRCWLAAAAVYLLRVLPTVCPWFGLLQAYSQMGTRHDATKTQTRHVHTMWNTDDGYIAMLMATTRLAWSVQYGTQFKSCD